MRILVDEDLASRELLRRLDEAFPGEVLKPATETADEDVWARAQREGAAILTGNVVDFLPLAEARPDHHGLLLVYRTNNRRTDLRAVDIAAGVVAVAEAYPNGISALVLAVNDFHGMSWAVRRRRPPPPR